MCGGGPSARIGTKMSLLQPALKNALPATLLNYRHKKTGGAQRHLPFSVQRAASGGTNHQTRLNQFNRHGNGFTATDTQAGNTFLAAGVFQRVHQGNNQA